jgi:hypothetical protein
VNEFVQECRSEWKRLGVPDPVANEMAADLAADLAEAEAEGASAEDVLGSGVFDARAFATAWAAERGLIRQPPPSAQGVPRRARILVASGAFTLIAVIGAVLMILPSSSPPERVALASARFGPALPVVLPPSKLRSPAPGTWLVWPPAVDTNDSGFDTRSAGSVLLALGLVGAVPLTLFWLWSGGRRGLRSD